MTLTTDISWYWMGFWTNTERNLQRQVYVRQDETPLEEVPWTPNPVGSAPVRSWLSNMMHACSRVGMKKKQHLTRQIISTLQQCLWCHQHHQCHLNIWHHELLLSNMNNLWLDAFSSLVLINFENDFYCFPRFFLSQQQASEALASIFVVGSFPLSLFCCLRMKQIVGWKFKLQCVHVLAALPTTCGTHCVMKVGSALKMHLLSRWHSWSKMLSQCNQSRAACTQWRKPIVLMTHILSSQCSWSKNSCWGSLSEHSMSGKTSYVNATLFVPTKHALEIFWDMMSLVGSDNRIS